MRYTNACFLLAWLSTLTSNALGYTPLSSSLGPVVDLGYTALVGNSTSPTGVTNSSVTFFGGVPYVQPPLGNLRFRAPKKLDESLKSNRTIFDARNWGPTCVQQPAVEGVGVEGMSACSSIAFH